MIFTSEKSGSDELLRPSLAATRSTSKRVPRAARATATRHLFRRTPAPPPAAQPARRRKVIEEAHQQQPPARVNVKRSRGVEDDRAGDGHDEARYYRSRGDPGGREATVAGETAGCANRLTLHFLTPLLAKGSGYYAEGHGPAHPVGPGRQCFATFQEGLGPPRRQGHEKRRHPGPLWGQLGCLGRRLLAVFHGVVMLFY